MVSEKPCWECKGRGTIVKTSAEGYRYRALCMVCFGEGKRWVLEPKEPTND